MWVSKGGLRPCFSILTYSFGHFALDFKRPLLFLRGYCGAEKTICIQVDWVKI